MDPQPSRESSVALERAARGLGFRRVAVAAAGRSPHADRYLEWLAAGYHGTMDYMVRNVARRIDPRRTLPGARSVIAVTLPYVERVSFPPPESPERGKISRYARGRDYHKVMTPLLRRLDAWISAAGRWRCWSSVDAGPILERDWAEKAGIGWIGKNGLIIDREIGSYFFLGVIVTDRAFEAGTPALDHCGTCRACLDACPTGAIVAPRSVEARRCISYLTIEHDGEIDDDLARAMDGWVFGCDICQEVCPYNRRRARPTPAAPSDLTPRPLPDDLHELAGMDRQRFLAAFSGTPVMRAGVERMTRSARIALGRKPANRTGREPRR